MPNIHAVTPCVNYTDYLATTYEHNRGLFASWTIVTVLNDTATQQFVTSRPDLTLCLVDNCVAEGTDAVNAGKLRNRGLQQVYKSAPSGDWFCAIDADTVVKPEIQSLPLGQDAALRIDNVYGARRVIAETKAEFQTCLNSDGTIDWVLADINLRTVPTDQHGYGYLQLFFRRRVYPENRTGGGEDIAFVRSFSTRNKFCPIEIPSLRVIHLGAIARNWYGRVTPFWTTRLND